MKGLEDFLKKLDPKQPKNAGGILIALNILAMTMGAVANTVGAAIDKSTTPEEKKFTIPAGVATGVANVGAYYLITNKIADACATTASNTLKKMSPAELEENVTKYANRLIEKAGKGLFKKPDKYIEGIKNNFFDKNGITDKGKNLFIEKQVGGASVIGALIGAFIGCAIITPIFRDVTAYFMQKHGEKKKASENKLDIKEQPIVKPNINVSLNSTKAPVTMKNYMNFAKGSMKI